MLNVPSVTMNGGSRSHVTSAPLTKPKAAQASDPEQDRQHGRHVVVDRHLRHDDRPEGHHRAARQVDARGEDDERLADGQRADHHHLLEDQREVRRRQEPVGCVVKKMQAIRSAKNGPSCGDARPPEIFASVAGRRGAAASGGTVVERRSSHGLPGGGRRVRRPPPPPVSAGCHRVYPQQFFEPYLESLDSTPSIGSSVMRFTPVSL